MLGLMKPSQSVYPLSLFFLARRCEVPVLYITPCFP